MSSARSSRADSILISVLFKYFHFTCTRFGCSFLVRALYVCIFQLGFCMAQRAYSCTLKKGYARNACAFTNYDTLTLTRVLTFSYYERRIFQLIESYAGKRLRAELQYVTHIRPLLFERVLSPLTREKEF